MVFFFVFFVQLVVSVCWALGITSGSCGLITLTRNLDKGAFVTFFLVFVTFSLVLYAFASLLMLIQVNKLELFFCYQKIAIYFQLKCISLSSEIN